ncbi:MAG: four helix bundle protein [Saprospiraceae bacterium]|nr:four helix bundle protein [Saprospiraceae bacterium]HRG69738.1 four helix bundle protein [Saprospiraceae bacterium]
MRDYTKLEAFIYSDELVLDIYRLTSFFPAVELYGLTSQIRRAIISVPSNIVEGSFRESPKEFYRFLEIAFSSLKEAHYQMQLANRLGYLEPKLFQECDEKFNKAAKILAGLIKRIRN